MQNTTQLYKDLLAADHSVESKLDVYNSQGTSLVDTYGMDRLVSIHWEGGAFKDKSPGVGGTVSGQLDCEMLAYYPTPFIRDVEEITWVDGMISIPYVIYDSVRVEDGEIVGVDEIFRGYPEPGTLYRGKYTQADGWWVRIDEFYEGGGSGTELSPDPPEIPRMAKLMPYVRISGELEGYRWGRYAAEAAVDPAHSNKQRFPVATSSTYISFTLYNNARIVGGRVVLSGMRTIRCTWDTVSQLKQMVSAGYRYWNATGISNALYISDVNALSSGGLRIEVDSYFVSPKKSGVFLEYVQSAERTAYPDDNVQGDSWYVYSGTIKIPAVSEWLPKGEYWIDTRATDDETDVLSLHAYDAMLKGEQPFISDGVVQHWTRTDLEVLNGFTADGVTYPGIAQKLGVEIEESSLSMVDKGYEVPFPGVVQGEDQTATSVTGAALTVREVLSAVCAAYASNAVIGENGKLRLVPLAEQEPTIDLGLNVGALLVTPAFPAFTRVEIVVDEETGYYYPTTATAGRTLVVNCPWGTEEMAANVYELVNGYAYQPFEGTDALLDPAAQLGDGVTVKGISGVIYAITADADSLASSNIYAPQDEEIDHEYPFMSQQDRSINRKIATTAARLLVEASKIEAIVENIGEDGTVTAASIVAQINDSASEVKISADHIVLDGLVTAGEFEAATTRIGTLETNVANISTLVAQKADVSALTAATGRISTLESDVADIEDLVATKASITSLNSAVANINKFFVGTETATNIHAKNLTAEDSIYIPNGSGSTRKVSVKSVTIGGSVYNILTI